LIKLTICDIFIIIFFSTDQLIQCLSLPRFCQAKWLSHAVRPRGCQVTGYSISRTSQHSCFLIPFKELFLSCSSFPALPLVMTMIPTEGTCRPNHGMIKRYARGTSDLVLVERMRVL
jgi:hypothetical protein